MIKKQELEYPGSCLNKAADDEPLFVLRAQDKLAPMLVRLWADLALEHGCPADKVTHAKQAALKMQEFAARHGGGKWPD